MAWHIPSLAVDIKYSLFVTSTSALRVCLLYPYREISYYKITHRAMPDILCDYKMALFIFRSLIEKTLEEEWLYLNEYIINNSKQTLFKTKKARCIKDWPNLCI